MAVSVRTLETIKSKDLSVLIEASGCSLKASGREFVTHCIWHEDKNPSLTINDDKGFCFCHACRKGGDHFDFIEQRYSVSFRDAAERAASLLGIEFHLEDENPEAARRLAAKKKKLIENLSQERDKYAENLLLPNSINALLQLSDRGIHREAVAEFQIGYAKDGFYKERITLPIYNHKDEIVGFTARATKSNQEPKYKNSKGSDLFNKTEIVFNESRAKKHAKSSDSIIFVEGNLDVVSMWQAGIKNAVAIQGTGTPDTSTLLRVTKNISNIVLCFDGDQGGRTATERFVASAHKLSLQGHFNILVANLPLGMDPDEVIRNEGVSHLYSYIANASPWLDWTIDLIGQRIDRSNHKNVLDIEKTLRQYIDQIPSVSIRKHYISKAALLLAEDEDDAQNIAQDWGLKKISSPTQEWSMPNIFKQRQLAEARLLRIYIHKPRLRARLEPLLALVEHAPYRWLVGVLKEIEEVLGEDYVCDDVAVRAIMAESHYAPQVRRIIDPSVKVSDKESVIKHLEHILGENSEQVVTVDEA